MKTYAECGSEREAGFLLFRKEEYILEEKGSRNKMVVLSLMKPEAEETALVVGLSGTYKRLMIAGGEMS